MILTNINVNIVRNQNEYEKYVYEAYRKNMCMKRIGKNIHTKKANQVFHGL